MKPESEPDCQRPPSTALPRRTGLRRTETVLSTLAGQTICRIQPCLVAIFAATVAMTAPAQIGGSGWTPATVKFHIQSPTNALQSARYFVTNSPLPTYHCLVYSNDGAFSVGNTTSPRTEQRFDPDYTSGEIQYQATLMAPANENSYCIFQIHTGDAQSPAYGSTTFMAFWFTNYGGSLHDYSGTPLATNLGNQWFQLNVDHNLTTRTIKVWVNEKLVWTQEDNGAGDFYFKDGVYEQSHNPTIQMDTDITNILMWTSPGSPIVPLTWTGQTNGVNVGAWDLGITTNWMNSTNGAIQFYQDGSPVIFNDSAPGATAVNLQTTVFPAGITVSNAVKNYTFAGSGSLGGSTSLAKYGGGMLTVDTANSFTGGVMIGGGIFQAGNAVALGSTSGTTVITNGGTLDVNGNNLGAEPIVVSGWGVNGNGAIVSASSSSQTHALQNVTLSGDTAFGGPGNWLTSGNPGRWDIRNVGTTLTMSGGKPFNLYKVGSNQMSFVSVTIDTNLANVDVQEGMMGFEAGSTSMGNPASNLIVRAGATLEFYQSSALANSYTKQFVLYGGGTTPCITNWPGGGSSTISGRMTLNGDCVIGVNGTSFTNNCVIVGSGSLIKSGAKPLVLGGMNIYTGNTTVSGGVMLLQGNGAISNSAVINVMAGAILDFGGRNDANLTLANGQTLTGNGAVNGNVIVGSDATLSPGGGMGTLTFNNNLTLNSGSATIMEINKSLAPSNDMVQVAGNLIYGGTLVITNLGTDSFSAGDRFNLFSAANFSGAFTNLVPAIPAVNLAWNTNSLTNGILSVVHAPTPSPEISAINLNEAGFVITGTNGVPGWQYLVLASTNMALPLSAWARLTTNYFDAAGGFIFTGNVPPSASAQFYRLMLP